MALTLRLDLEKVKVKEIKPDVIIVLGGHELQTDKDGVKLHKFTKDNLDKTIELNKLYQVPVIFIGGSEINNKFEAELMLYYYTDKSILPLAYLIFDYGNKIEELDSAIDLIIRKKWKMVLIVLQKEERWYIHLVINHILSNDYLDSDINFNYYCVKTPKNVKEILLILKEGLKYLINIIPA